jgi:hypothetical protein
MYVGGGEVIALEYSKYLKKTNQTFKLFCLKGSYIEEECIKFSLEHIAVEKKYASLIFVRTRYCAELADILNNNFSSDFITILSITFRDLYNTILLLPFLKNNIRICHYILHPDDFKYGLSLRFFTRGTQKKINLDILNILNSNSCLILPNKNAGKYLLPYKNVYVPFIADRFTFEKSGIKKNVINGKLKIITISRFVGFKISSVIGMVLHVLKNNNLTLHIVGYGNWHILVKIFAFLFPDKILLEGKCSKDELLIKIKESDILYAQGTTILLGVSLGKPVLISHYSKWFDWMIGRIGSVGWYDFENLYDFGDYRIKNFCLKKHSFDFFLNNDSIVSALKNSENNDVLLEKLSAENVFGLLNSIVLGPSNSQNFKFTKLLYPPLIKKVLYKFKKW